jgi:hypothetical protein
MIHRLLRVKGIKFGVKSHMRNLTYEFIQQKEDFIL